MIDDSSKFLSRSERRDIREDAGAPVPDQQMSNVTPRYPVDRYLVESSKKFDMVNIIDDDIWNTEPVLRPEDEIILRKLHEMLQSTSDDLKLLSGELSKFHEPGVQVKMPPTPLDEEFNEKVHIEEVVNAKFHGYTIIENLPHPTPGYKPRNDVKLTPVSNAQRPKVPNTTQANARFSQKTAVTKKLGISRTTFIEINDNEHNTKTENVEKLNNGKVASAPVIAYNEISYKYEEPKPKTPLRNLHVQQMPCINIRSELKEQKVLLLDIIPNAIENEKANMISKNIAVVAIQHDTPKRVSAVHNVPVQSNERDKASVRKVSKMSTCESSGSINNSNSEAHKLKSQKHLVTSIRSSPKNSSRVDRKKLVSKKESAKPSHLNLDEWRKKLNAVYGGSNVNKKPSKPKTKIKTSPKKINRPYSNRPKTPTLNNTEYIPYSKLTIGGVRASDIEREISDIPGRNDIPLSPILDRILNSRENSFSSKSPRKLKLNNSPKVLTTSDENLLQEVIDIEKTVSETLSKDLNKPTHQNVSSDSDKADDDSYADDFEDDKTDLSSKSRNPKSKDTHSDNDSQKYSSSSGNNKGNNVCTKPALATCETNIHNITYTKATNLSFKSFVDIHEFVHSVDTHDSATQSNMIQKISPKETQTSPRNDNIEPIHNDLWPAADPIAEVEKMFKIEKEFIKNLIVEEYGELLKKNHSKPSTSKEVQDEKNYTALQKNTQTSPAHVKNVMTSPTKTKTRTTSPFSVLAVDHHTSPFIFVTNEDDVKVEIDANEDLDISINLSSPRFSLRLPQNSREVISHLEGSSQNINSKNTTKTKINTGSSSSSVDVDSSDISSLGEIKLKLRRKLRKDRLPSSSESTASSTTIQSSDLQSGILPLRSEGEMSLGNKKCNKLTKSEGETSLGLL